MKIYALIDPSTHLVFYVGKSVNLTRRLNRHTNPRSSENPDTRAKLEAIGYAFDVAVLEVCSRADLNTAERWWISYGHASGWPLTNRTDGGEGRTRVAPSSRALVGAASLRRFAAMTPAQRFDATRAARAAVTPEQQRANARRASAAACEALTKDRRSANARAAHAVRTPAQKRASGRKGWTTRRAQVVAR